MRFVRIGVPRFGHFTDYALEFPQGDSDFQLVFGPNEAGKSTLLRAVRGLLYGIPARSEDNFLHDYKELMLTGTIRSSDGDELVFKRRKGNKNTLLNQNNGEIPDHELATYLGNVDECYFDALFGLDGAQLHAGGDELLRGDGEIGRALFSAQLAGTSVHRILDVMNNEAQTYFKGSSNKNISLRVATKQYNEVLAHSKSQQVKPEAWTQVLKRLEELETRKSSLDEELTKTRKRKDWIARCVGALPLVGELRELDHALAALPPTPDVAEGFLRDAEQALQGQESAGGLLAGVEDRIEKLNERLEHSRPDRLMLDHEPRIKALGAQLGVYQKARHECGRLQVVLSEGERDLFAGMKDVGCEGDVDTIASMRLSLVEENQARQSAQEVQGAEDVLTGAREQLHESIEKIKKCDAGLAKLSVQDVEALREVLDETEGAGEKASSLSLLKQAMEKASADLESQQSLLTGISGSVGEVSALSVPAEAILRRFGRERDQITATLVEQHRQLEGEHAAKRDLRTKLDRLERGVELPTLSDLKEVREAREETWTRVLGAWRENAPDKDGSGKSLSVTYVEKVTRADEVADRLREEAEAVAQAEEFRLQLARVTENTAEIESKIRAIESKQVTWEEAWKAAWTSVGIEPGEPDEMQDWRETWVEYRRLGSQWRDAKSTYENASNEVATATEKLESVLHVQGKTLPVLRKKAIEQVRQTDNAVGERKVLLGQHKQYVADRDEQAEAIPGLEKALEAVTAVWRKACRMAKLPEEVSASLALELLAARRSLVKQFDAWMSSKEALAAEQVTIDQFEEETKSLSKALQLEQSGIEVMVSELMGRLDTATAARTRCQGIDADLQAEVEDRDRASADLRSAQERIEELKADVGCKDEDALRGLMGQLAERNQIKENIAALHKAMHTHARGEELAAFLERVKAEEADGLVGEGEGLEDQISNLEDEKSQLIGELREAEGGKRELDSSRTDSVDAYQEAQNVIPRIQRDATRFIHLQLAMRLLRQHIEKFRKQNQGPILARAGELFREITQCSFAGLGVNYDENDNAVIVGVREDDTEVAVAGMSEGTRDQLYLALRLAALEQHIENYEPMPVILDDLLATFDDDRVRAILPLLYELGRKTQIILFTHHHHIVELAREILGKDYLHLHEIPDRADVLA